LSPHERNLYHLAENLSMPVYQLLDMPVSEYFGWLEFYRIRQEEKEIQERKAKGDLLAGTPEEMVLAMTGGKRG